MIPFKTIIVDDEAHALATLTDYIQKTPNLALTGSYENPLEALEMLSGSEPPDIAFLDIDMPELSGLALAELAGGSVKIVFTSAYEQYALPAFGVYAWGYLLKPFSFETFLKTVQNVSSRLSPKPEVAPAKPMFFKASVKGKYIRLMSNEILYIEAMLNYVKIYTTTSDRPKVVYLTLKLAESELGGTNLIRVSRSYIINTIYMDLVEGNTISMSSGKKISLGESYKTAFFNYLKANSASSS